jgi:hypothetical protein
VLVDWDIGEGEASLPFVGDEIEDIWTEWFEDGIAVFPDKVNIGLSC